MFIGRETELERLHHALQAADSGQAQIVFIAGEAGSGKTSLADEFIREQGARDPELTVAAGQYNAQTGEGDPYLPFRKEPIPSLLGWRPLATGAFFHTREGGPIYAAASARSGAGETHGEFVRSFLNLQIGREPRRITGVFSTHMEFRTGRMIDAFPAGHDRAWAIGTDTAPLNRTLKAPKVQLACPARSGSSWSNGRT